MSKEEKKVVLSPQELAKILSDAVQNSIESAQGKQSGFATASKPFKKSMGDQDAEKYGKLISRPKAKIDAKKPLKVFKTGTFIDQLFLDEDDKPLGGIPIVGQVGLVGLSGCGKSILIQEIALRTANNGSKVVLVTSEDSWSSPTPRNDLQSRMKEKSDIMGLDWDVIQNNLFVLDTLEHSILRDWNTFVQTLRFLETLLKGIDLLIIDSVTLLESYRGAIKYRLLELIRWNQMHGTTAIFVSQRAMEDDADKLNMAGGLSISHNLDIVICVDKKKAVGQLKADFGVKQWAECHFMRVMACRLSNHNKRYVKVGITKQGFLVVMPISEVEEK